MSTYTSPGEGIDELRGLVSDVLQRDISEESISWPEKIADKPLQASASRKELKGLGEGRPSIPFGFKSGEQVVLISTVLCLISCLLSDL